MRHAAWVLAAGAVVLAGCGGALAAAPEADWPAIEKQFVEMPMEARRLTGPLFWFHGTESRERLQEYVEKVAEGGNGCFTAESRPHNDWLGPGWYRDLAVCLEAAKKRDLQMWIFDEKWWPSGEVGGKVPPEYGAKTMEAEAASVEGPKAFAAAGYGGPHVVAAVAGRATEAGIDGASLVDLSDRVKDGTLAWDVPAGAWKIMKFTWKYTGGGRILVDGASKGCVDWYVRTVYQPHYDRFKDDFGKTIRGYFYDEPETPGDWGTEVLPMLRERGADWRKALVAWKFQLAGEEQAAARYQYQDAFAEAWGRTLYGGLSDWCGAHRVVSMGHFLEHGWEYLDPRLCAGNMFQLQKYSGMGGIDLVCRQFYPGQRDLGLWQMAKLGSSISHVYAKADDLTMCEMFGAYGQDITYPQMKWLTDQMQVRGVNFMIPHSFNPKAPRDTDCPPYFYNGGYEPRWPLYRVYADYTSRLSLLLAGGRHVAPVAILYLGNSRHVGKAIPPEQITTSLDDALFDSDWMPYDVLENDATIADKTLRLHQERYRVLVVPPVEVIPCGALEKARAFFEAGGVVVGYGFLPTKSATLGKTSADIAALAEAVWGAGAAPGLKVCKTSPAGGRSYLLPEQPTPEELQQVLAGDAGIRPALEVVQGKTDGWLHVLHRVKAGRDVFLVCNQDHQGGAKDFRFRITAEGVPECWDAMRCERTAVPFRRDGAAVEVDLALEPSESALIVFAPEKRPLPMRLTGAAKPAREPIPLVRVPAQEPAAAPEIEEEKPEDTKGLDGCVWVWYPEGDPAASAPPGTRYFRKTFALADGRIRKATFFITCDNDFTLFVNGAEAGASDAGADNWRALKKVDVTKSLRAGANQVAIRAVNTTDQPSPAGLIGRLVVEFERGEPLRVAIDPTWKAAKVEQPGWQQAGFDDSAWAAAKALIAFGQGPWGRLGGAGGGITRSPVAAADPFVGRCELPPDLDLARSRVFLVADALAPEEAARVTVNGAPAGGFIGRPFRLDITAHLKPGANSVRIEPFAPKSARLVVYPR